MIITPNHVYKFTFKSVFSALNNIYRVESITSYAELLSNNIDIYTVTYKANNATDDAFKADLDTIRSGRIIKLVLITNESTVIYIPEHLFDKVPDGTIQKYLKVGLAIQLGIFDNINDLNEIVDEVEQIIITKTGIANKTNIFKISDAWMTKSEYQIIDDTRKAAITRISNHYTDKQKLLQTVDSLKTKIKYYEDLLISMQ